MGQKAQQKSRWHRTAGSVWPLGTITPLIGKTGKEDGLEYNRKNPKRLHALFCQLQVTYEWQVMTANQSNIGMWGK